MKPTQVTPLFESVLLLEDDPAHALLIKRPLAEFVGQVTSTATVAEALSRLADFRPELIITDLNLPDSNQADHIEKFSQLAVGVPILVLTSSTALEDAVTAMKLGAKDFIVKNFDVGFKDAFRLALSRVYVALRLEQEKIRLQREMAVLRSAIENSNDGLAVVNVDQTITYHNRAFADFVKLCNGELPTLNRIFGSCVAKSGILLETLLQKLHTVPAGGVWNTEVTFTEQRDSAYDLSLSVIPPPTDGSAAHDRYALWTRDISEQRRRERFQRDILSTTTHDLKGPLGALLLSCDMLAEQMKDRPRAAEIVLRMDSISRGMLNMIDEFLSARRLQEGTFILKPGRYVIAQVVEEVLQDYRSIAQARGISLYFEPEDKGAQANFDRIGMSRVIGNLLSNALKFTPRGGSIWVRTRVTKDEFGIAVQDTGSGMEPGEVQRIFERFSRLDKHRDIEGSGLGLFTVKSIVSAHDGRIDVTSSLGEGTTFDLSLPIEPPVNARGELISLTYR